MKKLELSDLAVSSFETEGPVAFPEEFNADGPTPATRCYVCGYTDGSCDSYCLPGPGGG